MKFSLVSRELIADSIEAVVHGLAYDGLAGFGGCDRRARRTGRAAPHRHT
jgi:dihydroxy-acid dehydratase